MKRTSKMGVWDDLKRLMKHKPYLNRKDHYTFHFRLFLQCHPMKRIISLMFTMVYSFIFYTAYSLLYSQTCLSCRQTTIGGKVMFDWTTGKIIGAMDNAPKATTKVKITIVNKRPWDWGMLPSLKTQTQSQSVMSLERLKTDWIKDQTTRQADLLALSQDKVNSKANRRHFHSVAMTIGKEIEKVESLSLDLFGRYIEYTE